jgi:hypothetical protein
MGLLRAGIIIGIIYLILTMIKKNKKILNKYYIINKSGITDKYIMHFIIVMIILFELII